MFKKIILAGSLLISIAAANAKNVTAFKIHHSKPFSDLTNEPLVSRMAADEDLKTYLSSQVAFANKIVEGKAGGLFLKYLQKTITATEEEALYVKLDLNQESFNTLGRKLGSEAQAFIKKYPELKQISEKQQKEILLNAFKKAKIDIKLSKAINEQECFFWWGVCNAACLIGCRYAENNNCYWECAAACGAQYGLCWLIES